MRERAFKSGLDKVPSGKLRACKEELMNVMGVKTLQSLREYSKGRRKLDILCAKKIEEVFERYGVIYPWGE